jgi:hypothetical protein
MTHQRVFSSEDARRQLAAEAALAVLLHVSAHSRPKVGALHHGVGSLPANMQKIFVCLGDDICAKARGRNNEFTLIAPVDETTSDERKLLLE